MASYKQYYYVKKASGLTSKNIWIKNDNLAKLKKLAFLNDRPLISEIERIVEEFCAAIKE